MAEFTERWFIRFRGAQRDLIDACGGVERVAELTSYGKSTVGRWRSPSDRDEMPYRVALQLEDDCGRALVTRLMVEFNGGAMTDRGTSETAAASLSSQAADLVELASRMVVETVRAKADGKVTPAEADGLNAILSSIDQLKDQIRASLAGVKAEGGLRVVVGKEGAA